MMAPQDTVPVCDYEGSDYQTSFWDHSNRAYEDRAEEVALRRLLPKSGRLLLEVGAGAGRNTSRYHGYQRIVVMDYARSQLQQAQQRLGRDSRYIYVAADVYRLPFVDALFDGATMIRVLHHMADAPRALAQIRRVMQPGSAFILEYANKQNLKAMLRFSFKKQSWSPFSQEPVEYIPLNFDFHPRAVRNWLTGLGFSIQKQLTVSHFRLGLFKRWIPLKVLVAMDALAQRTGDWWQLSPSVFLRADVPGTLPETPSAEMFCCPDCGHAPLNETSAAMVCTACGKQWPIQDGIYNFRQPLNP